MAMLDRIGNSTNKAIQPGCGDMNTVGKMIEEACMFMRRGKRIDVNKTRLSAVTITR